MEINEIQKKHEEIIDNDWCDKLEEHSKLSAKALLEELNKIKESFSPDHNAEGDIVGFEFIGYDIDNRILELKKYLS